MKASTRAPAKRASKTTENRPAACEQSAAQCACPGEPGSAGWSTAVTSGRLRPPRRQLAAGPVLRRVAQGQRRQRAQHRLDVVAADAPAHAHVRRLQALVQLRVARRHRAHQQVGAARGVLGQGLDRDVGAERLALARRGRTDRRRGRRPRCCRARPPPPDARAAAAAAPAGRGTPSSPSPAARARPGGSPATARRAATRAASGRRSDGRCPSAPARSSPAPWPDRRRCSGSAPRRRSSAARRRPG